MSNFAFYPKSVLTLLFLSMLNLVYGQTTSVVSNDPCKDVWVTANSKILMFSPEPGEVVKPVPVPVNGSLNPLIEWTWTPALGMVDASGNDGSRLLKPYFDVRKLGDLGGNAFTTTFFITGRAPSLGCNTFAMIDNISSYPEATITVIDRWGVPVFEGTGDTYEEKPFRGKFGDKALPTGVYMYRIKPSVDYPDVVGSLTIIR
jgi:hypothetical protein